MRGKAAMSKNHPPHTDDEPEQSPYRHTIVTGIAPVVAAAAELGQDGKLPPDRDDPYDYESDPDAADDFAQHNDLKDRFAKALHLEVEEVEDIVAQRAAVIESVCDALRGTPNMFAVKPLPTHITAEQIVLIADYVMTGEINF